jgi:F-type H+-transporting ATPase subunit b
MTEHGVHHAGIGDLLWPLVNFVLFVALLARYLRAPIRDYFRERTARLREALAAGSRAREEAAALRAALERDIADLPALGERLRADLRAAAEHERQIILESAREAATRLRTDAKLLAEHEFMTAREALRADVIDEAVRQAVALLRGAIGRDDHERFVREFVSSARTQA